MLKGLGITTSPMYIRLIMIYIYPVIVFIVIYFVKNPTLTLISKKSIIPEANIAIEIN